MGREQHVDRIMPTSGQLISFTTGIDEDITPSHTSQGEEEVQHGHSIHLSHGGDSVQLKLEPISGFRTSLS